MYEIEHHPEEKKNLLQLQSLKYSLSLILNECCPMVIYFSVYQWHEKKVNSLIKSRCVLISFAVKLNWDAH